MPRMMATARIVATQDAADHGGQRHGPGPVVGRPRFGHGRVRSGLGQRDEGVEGLHHRQTRRKRRPLHQVARRLVVVAPRQGEDRFDLAQVGLPLPGERLEQGAFLGRGDVRAVGLGQAVDVLRAVGEVRLDPGHPAHVRRGHVAVDVDAVARGVDAQLLGDADLRQPARPEVGDAILDGRETRQREAAQRGDEEGEDREGAGERFRIETLRIMVVDSQQAESTISIDAASGRPLVRAC